MIKNKYYISILLLLFFSSTSMIGQGFNNIKSFSDFNATNNNSNYSISNLYDYSNTDQIVVSNSIFGDQIHSFKLKPNVSKTLTELKLELESVPLSKTVKLKTSVDDGGNKKESKSFFKSEIFYFACAAVLASTAYLIWKKNDESVNTSKTFGTPPLPQSN